MGALELRWGLIIGGAYLVWLYAAYYLGLHTNGLGWIQVYLLCAIVISVTGYVLALRELLNRRPETNFVEGLRAGMLVAVVAAAVSALAQVGYFEVVNPGWTDYVVEETRRHYEDEGLSREQVDAAAEEARAAFGLGANAVRAALLSLVVGSLSSAIIMAFARRRLRP